MKLMSLPAAICMPFTCIHCTNKYIPQQHRICKYNFQFPDYSFKFNILRCVSGGNGYDMCARGQVKCIQID